MNPRHGTGAAAANAPAKTPWWRFERLRRPDAAEGVAVHDGAARQISALAVSPRDTSRGDAAFDAFASTQWCETVWSDTCADVKTD